MSDIYVHRYQDWDYSDPKGAKRRWFYRLNGRPACLESSAFDRACVRAAERIWRRRALRQRRAAHLGEQLELFARATDDTIKLMMPGVD